MFNFLRTSRSIQKSRLSSTPTLKLYRVKLIPNKAQRIGVPVLGLAITGFLLFNSYDNITKVISDRPLYIPVGLVQKLEPVPYKPHGPEAKNFQKFMSDRYRRVEAETAVLNAVRKNVQNSNVKIGNIEGFASPFWMTFALAAPPPRFARNYLSISLHKVEVVTRPIAPMNVSRLTASLYPQALATSFYSFGLSLYNSFSSIFRTDDTLGRYTKPSQQSSSSNSSSPSPSSRSLSSSSSSGSSTQATKSPLSKEIAKAAGGVRDEKDQQQGDIPLLPSGMVLAFNDALSDGISTLEREWSRDRSRSRPHPPRGWFIADGTIRLVGTELVIIVDFQAAINPENFDQGFVYELKARHYYKRQRGVAVKSWQKPGLPPDVKTSSQQQEQTQKQQQPGRGK